MKPRVLAVRRTDAQAMPCKRIGRKVPDGSAIAKATDYFIKIRVPRPAHRSV